jgi:hypothetical protein
MKSVLISLPQDAQQWFIYELSPAYIISLLELQEEFIRRFRKPNEKDVFEDDVDFVDYSSGNDDLNSEVVFGTPSSSLY